MVETILKYAICPLWFAYLYFVSGIGMEVFLKNGGLKAEGGILGPVAYTLFKERHRRKNMYFITGACLIAAWTILPWWQVAICALALWGVKFFGYWESLPMSILRGILESLAFVPLMYFTGNWTIMPLMYCVIGFAGANILSRFDPEIGADWWWICSAFLGGCVGIALASVL